MAKKNTGLSHQQLETAFRHRNFKPLYFLYGEETFLMDELQARLLETALQPHERDFNCDLIYGAEADVNQVLAACNSFPMMAERRVVIVRDFEKLKDNRRFQHYAAQPNPSAVVLLLCSTKPNLSAHPYRALKQHAAWGEFKPLYPREMPGWIQKRVERQGCRIDPDAVQMLADFVGTRLRDAVLEIDKLRTFAGERTHLTLDDVVRASGQTRECNVFELQRLIGACQYGEAVAITERLLQQASNRRGESLMIVSVLLSYFTKLWKLTGCLAAPRRPDDRELAKRIGVNPFFIKEYLASLRHYDVAAIRRAFITLLAADFELKGGSTRDERLILLLMMRRLLPRRPLARAA